MKQAQTQHLLRYLLIVAGLCFLLPPLAHAAAQIENQVFIKSSGTGQNSATVRTVIDNDVVEDVTINSSQPISYSRSIHSSSSAVHVTTDVTAPSVQHTLTLLAELTQLLEYYVSLLYSTP